VVGIYGVCYVGVRKMESVKKFFKVLYDGTGLTDLLILILLIIWMLLDRMEIYFNR
jgi:hypothetical protein